MQNEPSLAAVFGAKFILSDSSSNIKGLTIRPHGLGYRSSLAVTNESGSIAIASDSLHTEFLHITTSDDLQTACFGCDSGRATFITLHVGGRIRVWDIFDGALIGEYRLQSDINALYATATSVFMQTTDVELRKWREGTHSLEAPLHGYSKASKLRSVSVDAESEALAAVDCFGQLFVYDVSKTDAIAPFFADKKFGEAFEVDICGDRLALVCPLKVILYRVDKGRRSVDPMQSILVSNTEVGWTCVCIVSTDLVLGFSGSAIINLVTEEIVVSRNPLYVERCYRLSSSRLIVRCKNTDKLMECLLLKSTTGWEILSYPAFPSLKKPGPCELSTVASDGSHLFFVESTTDNLKAYPLSIPGCSFDLELPSPPSPVKTLSGSVIDKCLLAGFDDGSIAAWMVGSSKPEFSIQVTSVHCAIIRLQPVVGTQDSIACLDASGAVTIVHNRAVVTRLQPNQLMALLTRGFEFTIQLNYYADISVCRIFHLGKPELGRFTETWSVSKRCWVSSSSGDAPEKSAPSIAPEESLMPTGRRGSFQLTDLLFSRRGSVEVPKPTASNLSDTPNIDLSLLEGVRVNKYTWPFQEQIVSFSPWIDCELAPNRELLDSLLETRDGDLKPLVNVGIVSKSWQVGTRLSSSDLAEPSVRETLLQLMKKGEVQVRDDFAMGTGVQPIRLCTRTLFSLLNKAGDDLWDPNRISTERRVIRLLKQQILSICADSDHLGEDRFNVCALINLGSRPHLVSGYKTAVREIEFNESPVSESTHGLVNVVENVLQRIKDGRIRWFELELFTDAFPFVKKLITNKSLFHDVFCVLYSWIEPRGLKSRLAANCLITIGFRKPTSFGKRLSLMIKTTHAPEVPLLLLQLLVDRYRMHSIRFLPALFESIVLPCLDPMDYRVRKASVEPVTEIFKNLNKFYPMTAFHQNRQKFAIGSTQGQVIIYDVRSGTKWRILDGHTGPISAVGFDASGKYVCSYSATDSTVRVWHVTSGGVPGVTAVVVSSQSSNTTSVLGGLLGSTGGKCVQIKQLGPIEPDSVIVGIKHPFCLNYRIHGVKIRWTSETDVLLVRENGQGIQIRL